MEKIKVMYNIDRNAAVLAGNPTYGEIVVELDPLTLEPEQRETLVRCRVNDDGAYMLHDPYCSNGPNMYNLPVLNTQRDPKNILLLLSARAALYAKWEAEQTVKAAEKKAADDKLVAEILASSAEDLIQRNYLGKYIARYDNTYDPIWSRRADELAEKYAEARALAERKNKEEEELEAVRNAEKEAKNNAEREALRAWAMESGSELLRLRCEDGYEWEGLARSEWLTTHLAKAGYPEGLPARDVWLDDRDKPNLKELKTARDLRKALEDLGVIVEDSLVVWLEKYDSDFEDARPYPAEGCAAVRLEVRAPYGVSTRLILVK